VGVAAVFRINGELKRRGEETLSPEDTETLALVTIVSQRLFPTLNRQGWKVATEILVNTPAVANLIRNEKIHQIQNVMQTSRALGMHTLEMSIRQLIQSGDISELTAESFLQETMQNA
jgi:twitching motility protein PilT